LNNNFISYELKENLIGDGSEYTIDYKVIRKLLTDNVNIEIKELIFNKLCFDSYY